MIEDNSGPPDDYVDRVLKTLQHDNKSLSWRQALTFFEKAPWTQQKCRVLEGVGPFITDFSKEAMIEFIKKGPYSQEKLAAAKNLSQYLPPGLSYQDKTDFIKEYPYDHDKNEAKKIFGM